MGYPCHLPVGYWWWNWAAWILPSLFPAIRKSSQWSHAIALLAEAQNLSLNLEIISCWAKPCEKLFELVTSSSDAASTEGDVLTKMIQDEWYTKLYIKLKLAVGLYPLLHYTYQWHPWWDYSLANLWAERLYHQLANSLKIGIPYLYISIQGILVTRCWIYTWTVPFLFAKSRDDIVRQFEFYLSRCVSPFGNWELVPNSVCWRLFETSWPYFLV